MKVTHHTLKEVEVSGPYTPAIEIQTGETKTLYVSGQGTRDRRTGEKFLGNIAVQSRIALDNLKTVLESCDFSLSEVIKITLYLTDINDLPTINEVYEEFFDKSYHPARSTVAVAALPGKQSIEIDAIAIKENI